MKFQNKVLNLVKKIPKGRVSTYKDIGKALGMKCYRAVGMALHNNKELVKIPCHRVICSDGSIGGYSKGVKNKINLLRKEGVEVKDSKVSLWKYLYKFDK